MLTPRRIAIFAVPFVVSAILVASAVLVTSCGYAPFEAPADERRFAFEMDVEVPADLGPGLVRLWMPVPLAGDYQECGRLHPRSLGGKPTESYDDKGNRILYLEGKAPLSMSYAIAVRRFAAKPPRRSKESGGLAPDSPWLASTTRAPLEAIRKTALFATNRKTLVLDRARALFDAAVDKLPGSRATRGSEGELRRILSAEAADAFDRAVWFVSALRSLEIPAYVEHGWLLPPVTLEPVELQNADAWTRFEVPGMGFLPADPARALEEPERRRRLFGGLDEDRVRISRGRDVVLVPRQASPPLPRFARPHAELDGVDITARIRVQVRFRDLEASTKSDEIR